jgi:ABC-type sugar transport system ATPase subunit
MAQVSLQNISKVYPSGFRAVDGVSLQIADGEFIVLVGPSGCGKSTTLRLVAGLESDFSGDIAIDGRIVNTVEPKDRDIAMVFQNYALYPHMTAHANMAMALKLRGVERTQVEAKVRHAAQLLGITELLDRKPGQLSGGQRQRVALGRAIVREPKVFLFDEPLSNLDAKLRVAMRAEIKALHKRLKATAIYVTHDQEEAMTLGDRIVVMAHGRVQQAGTPMDVYRHPANRFVAGFVGTPPMNFVPGVLEQRAGQSVFVEQAAGGGAGASIVVEGAPAGLAPGAPVVAGIRPQALAVAQAHEAEGLTVTATAVDTLGDQIDLHATTPAGHVIVARLPGAHTFVPGQPVRLKPVTPGSGGRAVLLFEPGEFGRNLTL